MLMTTEVRLPRYGHRGMENDTVDMELAKVCAQPIVKLLCK